MIRAPRPDEIRLLPQIENAADRRDGRLWVATSPLNRPVGFALMKRRAGTAWLDQLSVLDRWQGRGFAEVPRSDWRRTIMGRDV